MFGEPEFGESVFGGAKSQNAPIPVQQTYLQLVTPCSTKACVAETDFGYSLQNSLIQPVVIGAECRTRICTFQPSPDIELYRLQDAILFNGTPITVITVCPPGYYCQPGSFPPDITYPPGTWVIPDPVKDGGLSIIMQLKGCLGTITRVLPPTATPAQIQAAADSMFLEAAQQQAQCDVLKVVNPPTPVPFNIALGNLSADFLCEDVPGTITFTASSTPTVAVISVSIVAGSLPAGMVLTAVNGHTFKIVGTPTFSGSYSFTIYAAATGGSGLQTYSINVGGITTASPLPDAEVDDPYSETLTQSGITGTLVWSVSAGALPSWLTLDSATGELSGTPPAGSEGVSDFTIGVTNGTNTCEKEFSLTTEAASVGSCADFEGIVWDSPFIEELGGGTAVGSFTGNIASAQTTTPAATEADFVKGFINNTGQFLYTGGAVNCCVQITVVSTALSYTPVTTSYYFSIRQNGVLVIELINSDPTGVYPFSLIAGVNSVIDITLSADCQAGGFGGTSGARSMDVSVAIGIC